MATDEIGRRLKESGLDRGEFLTGLFADRLSHAARFIVDLGVAQAKSILASAERDEITSVFTKAKGIGPVVIRNFWALRNW